MKLEKIICLLVLILVSITFLGIASASEVVIAGEKFNIPDGFKEDSAGCEEIKDDSGTTYIKCYMNSETDGIVINIQEGKDGITYETLDKFPGAETKTINGIKGLYNKNTTEFEYISNGKQIFVSAHDEDLLKEVLIKP